MKKSSEVSIVIGSKSVNSTGLIRSLGQGGVKTVFASNYSKIESKYTSDYLKLPNDRSQWLDSLLTYGKAGNTKAFVFPSDDATAFWLDNNYDILKKYFVVPNANGKMEELADKTVMCDMARRAGLNVPEYQKTDLYCANISQVKFPVIIKPYAAFAGSKGDICICKSETEYLNSIERLKEKKYDQVLIQTLLDSQNQREIGIMGMSLSDGRIVIPGIINKIRSYPSGRGSTSFALFSPDTSGVDIEAIERFIRTTGYVGLFDIEMIISDDVYWFIEINFRNGQYGYTPTAAGYNLPLNWIMGMKGYQIDSIDNIKEIYYINEREDYQHTKNGGLSRKEWFSDFKKSKAFGMYCPGDQRPFLRQYIKIPDRFVVFLRRIRDKLSDLIIKEEWNVAYRPVSKKLLWQENGFKTPFIILKNTVRYWAADPFAVSDNGIDYIFFEMFDRFKGKGVIGYREIKGGKVGKMKVAYEDDYHLSFPFIFKKNGCYYMMPESSEGNCLKILRAERFPDKWVEDEILMKDGRFVDSVLLENDREYLFTQLLDSGYKSQYLDLYIRNNDGKWTRHPETPIVDSTKNSRLAGAVFEYKGNRYRVAQDCSKEYGKRILFNQIDELNTQKYREHQICEVDFDDISLQQDGRDFRGIHTYNFNEQIEVIDLKNNETPKVGYLLNIIYIVYRKIRKQ